MPHHRQHRGSGPSLRRRSAPQKGGQAAQALGRSRGGFSTKVHVSVDALGNPLRFILTGGQQHDITQADALIADYAGEYVIADKGYDSQEFRQHTWNGACVRSYRHAPTARNPKDAYLYRERHLVECFINGTIAGYFPAGHQIPGLPSIYRSHQHSLVNTCSIRPRSRLNAGRVSSISASSRTDSASARARNDAVTR